jgi:predicted Zn-dependent protease
MNTMSLHQTRKRIKQSLHFGKLFWLTLPLTLPLSLLLVLPPRVLAQRDPASDISQPASSSAVTDNHTMPEQETTNTSEAGILDSGVNVDPDENVDDLEPAAIDQDSQGNEAIDQLSVDQAVDQAEGIKGKASDLLGEDAAVISRPQPVRSDSSNPVDSSDNSDRANNSDKSEQDQNNSIEANNDPDAINLDLSEFSGIIEARLNARQQKLIEADRLYQAGEIELAEQLYREAKTDKESNLVARSSDSEEEVSEAIVDHTSEQASLENGDPETAIDNSTDSTSNSEAEPRIAAIYEITEASPAAQVYWREYQAGLEKNLETRILVPLQLLTTKHPEFIPGHIAYAEALETYDRQEEALAALEQAVMIYPDEPQLMLARIRKLGEAGHWLESSIAAREFALLNPDHEYADEFLEVADQNLAKFKDDIRAQLRDKSITSAIVGAAGYALTGSLIGPLNSVQSLALIAQGESVVGEKAATSAQRQLELIEDPLVLDYVREVGQKLAAVSGRDEFNYEFYVIAEEEINAFALPGGKIFINAGAIAKTNSEAELAGLLAHEISHAVFSHGFQLVTQSVLNTNLFQFLPFGGTAANLFTLDYSRDMERQADMLGTRILTSSGYAADGLYNLMVTMDKQQKQSPPEWMSTHPGTSDRIAYIDNYINEQGYNRYAYEGVEKHLEVKQRILELMPDMVEKSPEETVYKLPNRWSVYQ